VKQTTTSETKSKRVTEIQTTTTLISRMNKIQYLKRRTPALNEKTKIRNKCLFSDIRNCYFGYPKYLFQISKIIIPDIRNYAKKAFYLRYPKKLFWISKITISDIRKKTFISDIKNCYF